MLNTFSVQSTLPCLLSKSLFIAVIVLMLNDYFTLFLLPLAPFNGPLSMMSLFLETILSRWTTFMMKSFLETIHA